MNESLEMLQLAALSHAARGDARTVFSICSVDDFQHGEQQALASVIVALMNSSQPVDPLSVMDRCSKVGPDLMQFYAQRVQGHDYGTATYAANGVADGAQLRRVTASVTRAFQQLTETQDPQTTRIVGDLMTDLQESEAHASSGLGVVSFEDVMGTEDEHRPWVMPHMLRTNDRLIITGPEGGGKSVLIAQMCLGASMGLNTLSLGIDKHEPLRVLMLDVENDRLQVKANMRKVWPYLNEMSGGVKPLIEWVDVRDIDLSDSVERQRVIRLAREREPQMMYLGSLYKLAPEGEKSDEQFTIVSRTVDRIRAETGTAILIEGHTGHGFNNDRNGAMRPYGSSMWMRWPEFGIGMVPSRDKPVELKTWRGHRSDDRQWPAGLRRGGLLPWEPISMDEWEALYN